MDRWRRLACHLLEDQEGNLGRSEGQARKAGEPSAPCGVDLAPASQEGTRVPPATAVMRAFAQTCSLSPEVTPGSLLPPCPDAPLAPAEVGLVQFHEPGIHNYSALLMSEDQDTLYVGAREAVFALKALDISRKQREVGPAPSALGLHTRPPCLAPDSRSVPPALAPAHSSSPRDLPLLIFPF